MDKEKMVEFFKESFRKEQENEDNCTYWWTLKKGNKNQFAIVMGWQDGFDTEDGWALCMKLAYLPTNSLMSEYNIDWLMPYDEETGDVYDTETSIGGEEDIKGIVDWLLDEYNSSYMKSYIENLL